MNFTDFLYNVFILKRYEAKACEKTNRKSKSQSAKSLKPDLDVGPSEYTVVVAGFRSERTLSFWKQSADEIALATEWTRRKIGQQKSTKPVNEIHGATSEFH